VSKKNVRQAKTVEILRKGTLPRCLRNGLTNKTESPRWGAEKHVNLAREKEETSSIGWTEAVKGRDVTPNYADGWLTGALPGVRANLQKDPPSGFFVVLGRPVMAITRKKRAALR